MSAETEIRAALAAIKKADGQRELIQAQFELARVCSDDNITALLAKIDALQKDAERYRFLRSRHWNEGGLYVIDNPLCKVQLLGLDCPSDERLDGAIDAAIAQSKQGGAT